MVETMDLQVRDELYRQITRAKEKETKLEIELESLKKEFNEFKETVITQTDEAPTFGSGNLLTSGVIYNVIMSMTKKIDSLR